MFRFGLWTAGLIGLATANVPTTAAETCKVDRTIRKEPDYKTEPLYFLLWFGPEAKTRVWVVLDDDDVYIDQNGNSDLTEPTEKGHFLELKEITSAEGKGKIKIRVNTLHRDNLVLQAYIQGRFPQSAVVKPTNRPEDAPIHHIDGPLCIGLGEGLSQQKLIRGPEPVKLYASLGTFRVCSERGSFA